jgi:outer membrane murein-binding lipoprotein Lpp
MPCFPAPRHGQPSQQKEDTLSARSNGNPGAAVSLLEKYQLLNEEVESSRAKRLSLENKIGALNEQIQVIEEETKRLREKSCLAKKIFDTQSQSDELHLTQDETGTSGDDENDATSCWRQKLQIVPGELDEAEYRQVCEEYHTLKQALQVQQEYIAQERHSFLLEQTEEFRLESRRLSCQLQSDVEGSTGMSPLLEAWLVSRVASGPPAPDFNDALSFHQNASLSRHRLHAGVDSELNDPDTWSIGTTSTASSSSSTPSSDRPSPEGVESSDLVKEKYDHHHEDEGRAVIRTLLRQYRQYQQELRVQQESFRVHEEQRVRSEESMQRRQEQLQQLISQVARLNEDNDQLQLDIDCLQLAQQACQPTQAKQNPYKRPIDTSSTEYDRSSASPMPTASAAAGIQHYQSGSFDADGGSTVDQDEERSVVNPSARRISKPTTGAARKKTTRKPRGRPLQRGASRGSGGGAVDSRNHVYQKPFVAKNSRFHRQFGSNLLVSTEYGSALSPPVDVGPAATTVNEPGIPIGGNVYHGDDEGLFVDNVVDYSEEQEFDE